MSPEEIKKLVREELMGLLGINKFIFQKNIQILDTRNIQLGRTNGTKIGTATDEKIGLYGKTPVVQAGAITAPSGGAVQDAEARTAIGLIINAIKNIGITA